MSCLRPWSNHGIPSSRKLHPTEKSTLPFAPGRRDSQFGSDSCSPMTVQFRRCQTSRGSDSGLTPSIFPARRTESLLISETAHGPLRPRQFGRRSNHGKEQSQGTCRTRRSNPFRRHNWPGSGNSELNLPRAIQETSRSGVRRVKTSNSSQLCNPCFPVTAPALQTPPKIQRRTLRRASR